MQWRKTLWAIEFRGSMKNDPPMMLGQMWHELGRFVKYAGEPTRALLFQTREDARAYCAQQRAKNKDRTDCCKEWRFRPVRVVETVKPI